MKNFLFLLLSLFLVMTTCQNNAVDRNVDEKKLQTTTANLKIEKKTVLPIPAVKKVEVPILCYHRIRKILATDGANMKAYSVTPESFASQMKTLHENGYETILPGQLYDYMVHDGKLPNKPVMITFDDTREEQYSLGATEMNKYGFKGVFFIMTVSINRPGYMTDSQIKYLSDKGHEIGVHTWDHHLVTKYEGNDWDIQLVKPKKRLETITGKTVSYFAYPSGVWDKRAIDKLKTSNYRMAFILSTNKDTEDPLYTIRRIIVYGSLSSNGMLKKMQTSFK